MKEEPGFSKLWQHVLAEGQAKTTVSILEVKREIGHKGIRAIAVLPPFSHLTVTLLGGGSKGHALLLLSSVRQMLLHEYLKILFRVFVESGEGSSTWDWYNQAGCGGLRHQGNVLWARLAGSGASSPSLPSQSATVLLLVEVIIFLTRSLLLLAFTVHLAERFLLDPGASCLFRYVPWVNSFWHHMSHFSTGQPLLVLHSTVSVLSSVMARHSNLASLPPLLCPQELF